MFRVHLFGITFSALFHLLCPTMVPKFLSEVVIAFLSLGAVLFHLSKLMAPAASYVTGS